MKKDGRHTFIFVLIILAMFGMTALSSCTSQPEQPLTQTQLDSLKVSPSYSQQFLLENYKVIVIDGCEYIVFERRSGYGGYGYMAHKGNCKNPIHGYYTCGTVTVKNIDIDPDKIIDVIWSMDPHSKTSQSNDSAWLYVKEYLDDQEVIEYSWSVDGQKVIDVKYHNE